MVNFMENPIKMDDLGGFPIFLETASYKQGEIISLIFRAEITPGSSETRLYGHFIGAPIKAHLAQVEGFVSRKVDEPQLAKS